MQVFQVFYLIYALLKFSALGTSLEHLEGMEAPKHYRYTTWLVWRSPSHNDNITQQICKLQNVVDALFCTMRTFHTIRKLQKLQDMEDATFGLHGHSKLQNAQCSGRFILKQIHCFDQCGRSKLQNTQRSGCFRIWCVLFKLVWAF